METLQRAFVHGWDAPSEAPRPAVAAPTMFPGDIVGEVPSRDGTRVPVSRLQKMVPDAGTTKSIATMWLWAGESVGAVMRVQPAAEIVADLADEADLLLGRWGGTERPSIG